MGFKRGFAVLSWSNDKYKLTLGVGGLAITGLLVEFWKDIMPFWLVLVIALLPLVVFMFVHPDELPNRFVRLAHIGASIWYIVVAIGLSIGLAIIDKPLPGGWLVFLQ